MIVRMAKVEIVGPKGLIEEVLRLLKEMAVFQIEPATVGFIEKGWYHPSIEGIIKRLEQQIRGERR